MQQMQHTQQTRDTVNVITASQLERMLLKVGVQLLGVLIAHSPRQHAGCVDNACRTRCTCQVADSKDDHHKEAERLRLKQLSEERAAKWPNTLQV